MKPIRFTRAVPIAVLAGLGAACGADPGDVSIDDQGRMAMAVVRTDIVADEAGAQVRDEVLVNA